MAQFQPRTVAVIVGSDSDLKEQCKPGLQHLYECQEAGLARVTGVHTFSCHRNTMELLDLIGELVDNGVDVIIAGAGWANALTGIVDSYLRYTFKDDHVVVIGVAFEDEENSQHTLAACLGITEVPGRQTVFQNYTGKVGFTTACEMAVTGQLPAIKVPDARPSQRRTLQEALNL